MKRTIFYLDDDASQLELFREMFGDDYDVRTATTPAGALAILAECTPDIIISDQLMPEIKGTEFLREAKQLCPSSVRMLLTGALTVGEVLPEVSGGLVQFFLTKPWTEAEMRAALERAEADLSMSPKPPRKPRARKKRNG
jgi:DNA-binding NtrC family response regulator